MTPYPPHTHSTLLPHYELWHSAAPVEYPTAISSMEARIAKIHTGDAPALLWLLEHPPLYTAGTSAKAADLLSQQFPVYNAGRGGEYTYHGPGQRVAYCMVNLATRPMRDGRVCARDIRCYVHDLESAIIGTLAHFGVTGERREGRIGVWVVRDDGCEEKIAALGIRVRRWVSYHGIAINVNPDLSHFEGIVPCGIRQHGVTSLHALGKIATMQEVDAVLVKQLEKWAFTG